MLKVKSTFLGECFFVWLTLVSKESTFRPDILCCAVITWSSSESHCTWLFHWSTSFYRNTLSLDNEISIAFLNLPTTCGQSGPGTCTSAWIPRSWSLQLTWVEDAHNSFTRVSALNVNNSWEINSPCFLCRVMKPQHHGTSRRSWICGGTYLSVDAPLIQKVHQDHPANWCVLFWSQAWLWLFSCLRVVFSLWMCVLGGWCLLAAWLPISVHSCPSSTHLPCIVCVLRFSATLHQIVASACFYFPCAAGSLHVCPARLHC